MRRLPRRLAKGRGAGRGGPAGADQLPQAGGREAEPPRGRGRALGEAFAGESERLEGRGRVLVRGSGTEQLVRVMVEAPQDDEADAVSARLVAVVERSASPAWCPLEPLRRRPGPCAASSATSAIGPCRICSLPA